MIRNILLAFLLISSISVTAQRTNSSPYSFFGVGEEFRPVTVEQSAMGGIGVSFNHYKYLNFTNPAAYSNLRYTTYSFGMLNNRLSVDNGSETQTSNSTGLSYFTLAFPLGSKAGMSVGIQPVSSVGYSLINTVFDSNGDAIEASLFEGSGGVNRFYGAFGINVYKGLSLGIEADFSFGNVENNITNQIAGVSLATKYRETNTIRGGSVKFGAQYQQELKNKLVVNAGATVKLGNNLDVEGENLTYSLSLSGSGAEIVRDTLVDVQTGLKINPLDFRSCIIFGSAEFKLTFVLSPIFLSISSCNFFRDNSSSFCCLISKVSERSLITCLTASVLFITILSGTYKPRLAIWLISSPFISNSIISLLEATSFVNSSCFEVNRPSTTPNLSFKCLYSSFNKLAKKIVAAVNKNIPVAVVTNLFFLCVEDFFIKLFKNCFGNNSCTAIRINKNF